MNEQKWIMVFSLFAAIGASLAFAYLIGWWLVWVVVFLWAMLIAYSAREVMRDEQKATEVKR